MKRTHTFLRPAVIVSVLIAFSCSTRPLKETRTAEDSVFQDTAFYQEFHEAWPVSAGDEQHEVRGITVDDNMNVWIATNGGVFVKRTGESAWSPLLSEEDQGPSYAAIIGFDSAVWMATWKGVYRVSGDHAVSVKGTEGPVSVLAAAADGIYALGPRGIWRCDSSGCNKQAFPAVRSMRDAVVDVEQRLWVGTDVGLYRRDGDNVRHFLEPDLVISAYIRGLAFDQGGHLWAAGLGGVSILKDGANVRKLTPETGIPSVEVNTVRSDPGGTMWVGTDRGIVRYRKDKSRSLLFTRRWLMDDKVNDIAFDKNGNAWVATARGVSAIKRKEMTLEGKAAYFYDVLMRRHIRDPWIAGQCKLPVAGDTTVWLPDDDDNDGEYTGTYLAMEAFRFATTGDPQARENARKAFEFLRKLQEVTGNSGFFARTMVPSHWTELDDGNRTYSSRERADELVKEPRFKPVEVRWHKSADGKWLWKGDTSSDELSGHMLGYFFYYELVADEAERKRVASHVSGIVEHLLKNDFTLIDVDGTHTRWAVWSPDKLNKDPEWMPDRNLNSMELLSFVKLAHHMTGNEKYGRAYRTLIDEHGYLDNMKRIPHQNPGWFVYYDVMLAAYQYPILLKYENDPQLLAFYEKHMDDWFERYKADKNPLFNFLYCYSRNKKVELPSSVSFLQQTPLDLVDWPINHTLREDVRIVRQPVLEELQVDSLTPPAIRGTIRWDKNPYSAISGNPHVEREPVFWLLPYWMGRYLGMIRPAYHQE